MLSALRAWLRRRRRRAGLGGRRGAMRMARSPFYRRCPHVAVDRLRSVDGRILVSHKYRYLYVRVPKCANSTIVLALGLAELGWEREYWQALPADERDTLFRRTLRKTLFTRPSELDEATADDVIDNWYRFIFVRNPFTRVASAYLDKVASGNYRERMGFAADIDFAGFCDFLRDGGLLRNVHWMPQTALSPFPADTYDFIGRFESLDADLARVTERLHGTARPVIRLASHATRADQRLRELYGAREQALIARLYAEDFATFGYDPQRLPG